MTKKPIVPLGGYTLPSSLWHSWGGRNCDFLYIFGIVGDLSWGHLGHIIRYAFEWTGTECHGILRYGKIYEYSLFVVVYDTVRTSDIKYQLVNK